MTWPDDHVTLRANGHPPPHSVPPPPEPERPVTALWGLARLTAMVAVAVLVCGAAAHFVWRLFWWGWGVA